MFGFHKLQQMEWQHEERMKCIEKGIQLPDAELAWMKGIEMRSNQLTSVMILGTLALVGGPVAGTAILLGLGQSLPPIGMLFLLGIMWCACAFVLLSLTRHTMAALAQIKRATSPAPPVADPAQSSGLKLVSQEEDVRSGSSEAIQSSL